MKFAFFIATRYLFAKRKQTFIYIISLMSILGVGIGVAALVIVLGVYNGFTTDIREKILGANAHIIITGPQMSAMNSSGTNVLEKITKVPGVKGVTPFVYAEVMLSSARGVKGVILRGIEPQTASQVLNILSKMKKGSLQGLNGETPGIIIGQELATRLGVDVGSRVNLLSPSGQKGAGGFTPRIRPFEVTGIFQSHMFEYDSSMGFVSLEAAREVLGLPSGFISGVEALVNDVYQADKISQNINSVLGPGYMARSWMEMNANLFAALQLEKIGMFILLAMVVLIGSFSIVTSLVMLVMEKTRDIAILMSMGTNKKTIRQIFMIQGTIIGVIGTCLGYVLGISLSLLLQRYQFIKLPKGVYTTDHLPILLNWSDNITIGVSAMLLCFLATIYPSYQAAKLEPVEALRYE